jgi:hypothetical protein
MFIYIEYKGNIYQIPTLETESYEISYQRAWWIVLKEPKNIQEYQKYIQESYKWSFENYYGVKY